MSEGNDMPCLTRRELWPINCANCLTPDEDSGSVQDENTWCDMCNEIDRLTSRHIAKLLSRLGNTIPPVVEQEIKRQFRFLSDDVKRVTGEKNDRDNQTEYFRSTFGE